MEQDLPVIAVVIPAYQVEKHIGNVLAGLPPFISLIVVVDDGSTDHTAEIVKGCSDPRVYLISYQENHGVGAATYSGYLKAVEFGAEIIVKVDGDNQMDPAYLPILITPILMGEADYSKGNRFLHASELGSMPLARRIGNVGLSLLTKLASGYWDIFDPTNGYTAITANLVYLLDDTLVDKRYFFETRMLIELGLQRAVVRDVYIPARYGSEESSLSEISTLLQFPPKLLKSFIRRLFVLYYLRDFGLFSILMPTGIMMVLFGTFWGLYHWIRSFESDAIATTGTVMISVLPIILGIQFILQAISIDIQNVPKQVLSEKVPEFILSLSGKD